MELLHRVIMLHVRAHAHTQFTEAQQEVSSSSTHLAVVCCRRRMEMWLSIQELNEQGEYSDVEMHPGKYLGTGVFQL